MWQGLGGVPMPRAGRVDRLRPRVREMGVSADGGVNLQNQDTEEPGWRHGLVVGGTAIGHIRQRYSASGTPVEALLGGPNGDVSASLTHESFGATDRIRTGDGQHPDLTQQMDGVKVGTRVLLPMTAGKAIRRAGALQQFLCRGLRGRQEVHGSGCGQAGT